MTKSVCRRPPSASGDEAPMNGARWPRPGLGDIASRLLQIPVPGLDLDRDLRVIWDGG
jgi:hypothetical protein